MTSDEKKRGIKLIPGGPGDFWAAFKNIAVVFSFFVNVVLLIALLIFAGWLMFPLKTDVVEPKLDQLQSAVDALESATIQRTIQIDQQVPVSFTLPLNQSTTVILSQDVELVRPATFLLPGGGGSINGTVILSLPTGTELPIVLDMAVPVNNSIAVQFPVDVSIPLKETELNRVVTKLNEVIIPIRNLVEDLPDGFR
jgi:hypothetical protein